MAVVPKPEPEDIVLPPAPAPAPAPAPPKSSKPAPEPKTRADALKEISGVRRVTAWSIHRWPLEKRVVQERTRVHLPRTYRARHGVDVRTVFPEADLNQFVHGHYMEVMGAEREGAGARKAGAKGRESEKEKRAREEWPNYVAGEAVLAKRHEFLGPDPRVSGYKLDANGDYHIKWYDAFLKDHWVDDQKWDFDVRLDARGNWVEVDDDAE
ncbi:hypothetical protein TRAPUB_11069 [Trametes pubescens]|uniref:Uncharacterized protein n=1 Tax=Trametes pubescens TaxID=154538 RepID=A0A1M2VXN8_TRAPU|nr:hypothetical protein TRAPUB_11069 [Trametes pubescens]